MLKRAFMGIDLGGTGVKAGVFDEDGRLLAFCRAGWKPGKKGGGLYEIPAQKILRCAKTAVSGAAGRSRAPVSAVCVVSQGQTFVSLDRKDRPLHEAVMWYDSRAGEQAERLNKKIRGAGGKEISPICTAAKILWLREKFPEKEKKAVKHLLLPGFINYMLTGSSAIDQNTACSTGLCASTGTEYSRTVLEAAGIPVSRLSKIAHTGETIGTVSAKAAPGWGLEPGIPVISGTNDQYAGAIGAGNCRPGILTETTGTCMAAVCLAGKIPPGLPAGILSGKFPLGGYFYVLSYSKTAGILLDWFLEEFCAGVTRREMEKYARNIPPGGGRVCVMPDFDGAVSPIPVSHARGAFINMSLYTSKYHIFRAIMESLGYSLKEQINHIEKTGIKINTLRSSGGGAKSRLFLQIKADILGMPVEKPAVTESAAMGGAMIAALGAGFFKSLGEASDKLYRKEEVFLPLPENNRIYSELIEHHSQIKEKILGFYQSPVRNTRA